MLLLNLIGALGLSILAAAPAPLPDNYQNNTLPQTVSMCPDIVLERMNIEFNYGVSHAFRIDFTESAWNVLNLSSSTDSFSMFGYFYVAGKASFEWYQDQDSEDEYFNLSSVDFYRFEGSYFQDDLGYFMPFPLAWQGEVNGQLQTIYEINTNVFKGLNVGGNTTSIVDSVTETDYAYVHKHIAQFQSGANPRYDLSVSDFVTFKQRIRNIVYTSALNSVQAYQQGYAVGEGYGYNNGKRDGKAIGYQEGLNASSDSALAGSLFAAIIGVPFDVLNGINGFMIWGLPIVSIIVTLLFIGVLVAIVKRFI